MTIRNNRSVGAKHEDLAADYLTREGVRILARNFHYHRCAEVDIIGMDGPYLVFFEVKYRSSGFSGTASEAVGLKKQYSISRTADFYLARYGLSPDTPVRFDVIAMDSFSLKWIKNAFDYIPH